MKKLSSFLFVISLSLFAFAQSNPTPFDLSSGGYSLTEWDAASPASTYPANMIFHRATTNDPTITAFIAGSNYVDVYNGTAGTRMNGLGIDGFSFINTGTGGNLGAAVLALDATGRQDIAVSFTAGTMSTVERLYAIRLQYRTAITESWVDVPGPIQYEATSLGHSQTFGPVVLPNVCNNSSGLQIRWVYHYISGTGSRPRLRLDDITITSEVFVPGIEVNLSSSTNQGNESDQTVVTLTATAVSTVATEQSVTIAVSGDNITAADFLLSNSTIIIPAGQTQGSVTFTVVDDNLNEGIETALVGITSFSAGLSLGTQTSISINIEDNDAAVTLTALDVPTSTITFDELQFSAGTNLFDITRGFYFFEEGTNANSTYRAGDGTSTTGDTYSFGVSGASERALGSLTTGSLTPNMIGSLIENNTGTAINAITVQYTGEQWRSGTATGDTLFFAYSLDATSLNTGTWVPVSALNFVAPINEASSALNGNDPLNQVQLNFQFTGFHLPENSSMWLRWLDVDVVPGTDHGMAIDNLILTPTYIPNPTIVANPNALSGFNQILGAPSAEQSFVVSGFDLTEDVVITAPSGYEISFTSGSGFMPILTLMPDDGIVSETTIYVRLNAAEADTYDGDIELISAPAPDAFVELTGVAVVPSPELSVNPTALMAFEQQLGTPSPQQTITVSGIHLVEDITIVSSGNYFVSTSTSGPFSQSVTLEETDGIVESTQIFVQLNATTAGPHVGQITVSTDNTSAVVIQLTGETIQPANLENQGAPVFVVYPNPAEDMIQVVSSEEVLQITLSDLNGRVVMVTDLTTLDIRQLQAGMYIMLIDTVNGQAQKTVVKK
jgi:hypothetical protein